MNKGDLDLALAAEKFNPRSYSLVDELKDEALCLRLENGRWCVYYSERGLQSGKKYFEDEASACAYFIGEMRSDPTTKIGWQSGFRM